MRIQLSAWWLIVLPAAWISLGVWMGPRASDGYGPADEMVAGIGSMFTALVVVTAITLGLVWGLPYLGMQVEFY